MPAVFRVTLAAGLLTAVVIGGFFIGALRTITDTGVDW